METTCRARGMSRLAELASILEGADAEHEARGEPTYLQRNWSHDCGTPACAIWHWAAANPDRWKLRRRDGWAYGARDLWYPVLMDAGHTHESAKSEFCLTDDEAEALFGPYGCGRADNAKEAAAYIRRFVAQNCPRPE